MSRLVGSSLPSELFERARGHDLAARVGIAVVIVTTDDAGWPHPAMLSYGDLVAVDSRRIRVAVHRTSRTAANLRRSGRLTFCFIDAGLVCYVKATVEGHREPMPGFPVLARFDTTVETVLLDAARTDSEPGAAVRDGIRFSLGRPVAAVLGEWQATVRALREDA
jgi:hypothetical protein